MPPTRNRKPRPYLPARHRVECQGKQLEDTPWEFTSRNEADMYGGTGDESQQNMSGILPEFQGVSTSYNSTGEQIPSSHIEFSDGDTNGSNDLSDDEWEWEDTDNDPDGLDEHSYLAEDDWDSEEDSSNNVDLGALDAWQTGFAVWCSVNMVTHAGYAAFQQLSVLLENIESVKNLPKAYSTLEKCRQKAFPKLKLRKHGIQLDTKKLRTGSKTSADLYTIDLANLFSSRIGNPTMRDEIYVGPQRIAKKGSSYPHSNQLWHGKVWGESIRATSGVAIKAQDGAILFPGDFVYYIDIYGIGRYARYIRLVHDENADDHSTFHAVLEPVLAYEELCGMQVAAVPTLTGIGLTPKFLMDDTDRNFLCQPASIVRHAKVIWNVDTTHAPNHSEASPAEFRVDYRVTAKEPYAQESIYGTTLFAEREIAAFSRAHLETKFVPTILNTDEEDDTPELFTIPIMVFVDSFGAYRNNYHSLLGIYASPACLPTAIRDIPANQFPLTLGPFGASLASIIECLEDGLSGFEAGWVIQLPNGRDIFLCIMLPGFTGDLHGQAANAAVKGPTSNVPCRYVYRLYSDSVKFANTVKILYNS